MKKAMTFSLIFSVTLLLAVSAYAQPRQRMMRGKGFMHRSPARILSLLKAKQKELDITENQLEKIKNLVFSFEEKMIQMKSSSDLQRLELRKLMQDAKTRDYEKIKAALSKASANRHKMFIERLKLRDEIHNVLTPEQQEAMKAMQKDRLRRGRRVFQRREMLKRFPQLRDRIKERIKK